MIARIAIVDDMHSEREVLSSYFIRYQQEKGVYFEVSIFENGLDFLENYQPIFDVVLMDIDMPHLNGMGVAARLREMDEDCILIFVTNLAQYAISGYEVNAFDFVIKPVSYSNFALKLQRALKKIKNRQDSELTVTISNQLHRIPASKLKYIEISGHNIIYHTTDGDIQAYGNLKEIEAKLSPKLFVRCNNCYLVNLTYVRAIDGYVVTVDSDELQISRPRKKLFVQTLNDFHGGEL